MSPRPAPRAAGWLLGCAAAFVSAPCTAWAQGAFSLSDGPPAAGVELPPPELAPPPPSRAPDAAPLTAPAFAPAAPAPASAAPAAVGLAPASTPVSARQDADSLLHFRVDGPAQRMEMIVNTSRILTLDRNIPRVLVNNPDLVSVAPLSPNQVQVSALKPGVTQINLWDDRQGVHTVDVLVLADVRELENVLRSEFPDAELRVRPSNASVIISGHVPRPDTVSRIVQIAEDYYPRVINNMTVGGVQQVQLHVQVLEVSRTKLRRLGVDWALLTGNDFVVVSAAGLLNAAATQAGLLTGTSTIRAGINNGNTNVGVLIDILQQNNLAKLLSEPTLTTVSGRPASFNVGGEVPIPINSGLGTVTVEYREFGTQVDFVPIVLGNGAIRLEVRPQVTEIDSSLRDAVTGTPGFRSRRIDTGVEMRPGQTLALAGLVQTRVEAERRGVPWLSDLPWFGAAFRRVQETSNEVELLILVTPELVEPLDPEELPPYGPGELTASPTDVELYWRGYLERPRFGDEGGGSPPPGPYGPGPYGPGYGSESVPAYGPAAPYEELPPGAAPVPRAPGDAPQAQRAPAPRGGPTGVPARPVSRAVGRGVVAPRAPAARSPGGEDGAPGLIGPSGYDALK